MNLIMHRRRTLSSDRCSRSINSYIQREIKAVKRAQWLEFCLGLEPKNTDRFQSNYKNLFKKRAVAIQEFRDERTARVLTNPNFMIEYVHRYYSEAFEERETSSQNQDATEFKRILSERLLELSSRSPSCSKSLIFVNLSID